MLIRIPHLLRLALVSFALFASSAWAQQFVSVSAREANVRAGPGTQHAVHWSLSRGYPLQIIARRGEWLQVRDFEKDTGWVHRSLTGKSTHMAVQARVANMRQQPRAKAALAGKLTQGDLVRTLERRGDWVRVRTENGKTGWVAHRLLWGG